MPLSNNAGHITKDIINPDHLTVLLPTRERNEVLDRMFSSMADMTEDKHLVDVWVYVDNDDLETRGYMRDEQWKRYGIHVGWYLGDRTLSQGEMNNTLWRNCTSGAGIYMTGTDDYLFVTPGWDNRIREGMARFQDRITIAYPEDPTALPGMVTFPIISAEWANCFGRVLTNYFPFWFDDTWLDQIGQMIDRKVALDMRMEPLGGKGRTPRMRNLMFWRKFFDYCTLDDRLNEADLLRRKIYLPDSPEYRANLESGLMLEKKFMEEADQRTEKQISFMEEQYSGLPEDWNPSKLTGYLLFEARIVTMLLERVRYFMERKLYDKAMILLDTMEYSSFHMRDMKRLKDQCQDAFNGNQGVHDDL